MNHRVHPSKHIQKAVKVFRRSGRHETLNALAEVINLLSVYNAPAKFVLREEWEDHSLKGVLKGYRELHLGFDQLLVYEVQEERKIIKLIDIVTHEELKKWDR